MNVSGKILLCILILSGFFTPRSGATVYYSNGSAANVQALHNIALNGDTITLPAGTFIWSTPVTISKAITIRGAGIGQTIILDNLPSDAGNIIFKTILGRLYRLTGIEFRAGSRQTEFSKGCVKVTGSTRTFRIDHCKWNNVRNRFMTFRDSVCGVVDHNACIGGRVQHMAIWHDTWAGAKWGDGSWASPIDWGGPGAIYFEDNTFIGVPNGENVLDEYGGARFVFRYNTVTNAHLASHGTGSTGRYRGLRHWEVYNNTFTATPHDSGEWFHVRGGTGVVFNNTSTGFLKAVTLHTYRFHTAFMNWSGSDGTSAWDLNGNGIYLSANAGAGSRNWTLVVPGALWAPNQLVGFTVRDTASRPPYPHGFFSAVSSNTSNTITVEKGSQIIDKPFVAGDHFEIRKVIQGLDMVGASTGDLLSGINPSPRWLHQTIEPAYIWNNTKDGVPNGGVAVAADSPIQQGVHFFNNQAKPNYEPFVYPHPLTLLPVGAARAVVTDFNEDGHPDWMLQNARTHQTGIWYLNNNILIGSAYGPTLPGKWGLRGVADFNLDSHADYALFNSSSGQTAIWYLSGPTFIGGAYGPTLPSGWELVATADFNGDSKPDYLLYNGGTRRTAIWYLNNNVFVGGAWGPTLPAGWNLVGVADFNRDGHPDYALFNSSSGQTAIWYLSGPTFIGGAYGPTPPSGWELVATADFNGDSKPDYLLYNVNTQQTAIWYLNNNVFVGGAYGPTPSPGWSLFSRE
jgi:hypothetical protein